MQRKKDRDPEIEHRQGKFVFYSDQGVARELTSKAKEEIEKKRPELVAHTSDGTTIEGGQLAGVLNSGAPTTQHDSLR
jgi:hypothetical protein